MKITDTKKQIKIIKHKKKGKIATEISQEFLLFRSYTCTYEEYQKMFEKMKE